jgi:hypothetical protein
MRLLHGVKSMGKSMGDTGIGDTEIFQNRLDDMFQFLESYDVTSGTILEKQKSLLSLV